MKIGILTFHTPINYGAALQVYALQNYLKLNFTEAEVKIIDFKTDAHIRKYKIFPAFRRNIFLYLYEVCYVLVRYKYMMRRKALFSKFAEEELALTNRFQTEEDFLSNVPLMDVFIVGSDQVFHPGSPYLRVYYMDFKKGGSKKISYAPSFGTSDLALDVKNRIRKYLLDFDSLSCRESDGTEFISSIVDKTVSHVLDPTFLLSQEDWKTMSEHPRSKISDKYIFVYDLNGGQNLIEIANKIKAATGFKIVCQTQKAHANYKVDFLVMDTGPREFVGFINNAEYVITDSFHGVAFSVNLRKKFLAYIAKPKAATRIISLLNALGLENRIVDNNKSRSYGFSNLAAGDYGIKLESMISFSKNYLLNSIKDNDNDICGNSIV